MFVSSFSLCPLHVSLVRFADKVGRCLPQTSSRHCPAEGFMLRLPWGTALGAFSPRLETDYRGWLFTSTRGAARIPAGEPRRRGPCRPGGAVEGTFMLACVDVDYRGDQAVAACVLFGAWQDEAPAREVVARIGGVAPYVPG